MGIALDTLILATGWAYVLLAPYTKIEETFNLHATHDVLMYGLVPSNIRNYDHIIFPGPVPRTCIGSIILAWISSPIIHLATSFGFVSSKFDLQVIVRLVLSTLNAIGLCLIRRAAQKRFGRLTGFLYAILTVSQFHIPFWMGRTLPNMFALLPVNIAYYLILDRAPHVTRPPPFRVDVAIWLLTASTVIFRSELLLLLSPLVLQWMWQGYISLWGAFKTGLLAGLASIGEIFRSGDSVERILNSRIALTTIIDSYLWGTFPTPLWPEFTSFVFNVVEGKSSDWGVSPFHTYVSTFVPKMLLSCLPLSLLGSLVDRRVRGFLIPYATFVLLISGLPHKEWRFIVYIVPPVNVVAARGAMWLLSRPRSNLLGRFAFGMTAAMILANVVISMLLATASITNYPGGEAMAVFNDKYPPVVGGRAPHISNLAVETGASLFLQEHAPPFNPSSLPNPESSWTKYDKTEHLTVSALTSRLEYTHLISEESPIDMEMLGGRKHWKEVARVDGFDGWSFDWGLLKDLTGGGMENLNVTGDEEKTDLMKKLRGMFRIRKSGKLWIYERKQVS
ncbi:hypothetical protein D9758_010189 [Tetrapyrgos nigripes]|uniref:Mannosyltransferase n=1 Tax=Tetrapyrgos nigripes TaxID=182062 RepID=A0A8H5CZ37_9AGAR|nr:hypothetical protein D9758_010189 [Tetrapyrgos nigripes]